MSTRPPYGVPLGQPRQTPRPVKIPLVPGQRRGALIAGGTSFVLIGGGVTVLVIYGVTACAALLFAGTWQLAVGATEEFGETTQMAISQVTTSGIVFLASCGIGYAVSYGILRIGRVGRPHLTTLLAAGIALTAWTAVGGLFVIVYLLAARPDGAWNAAAAAENQALGLVVLTLALVTGIGVGALSWWLSAHLLRPRIAREYSAPTAGPYA